MRKSGQEQSSNAALLQGNPIAVTPEPVNGDVLTFVVDEWKPSAPGGGGSPSGPALGDLGAVYPGPTVVGIQTVPVSATPPTAGQVLREDAGVWTPDTLDAVDVGADPSGTAAAAVAAHVALLDPHSQYTTAAEAAAAAPVQSVNAETGAVVLDAGDVGADPAGTASAAIVAHVALSDPHTQYATKLFLGTVKVVASLADLNVHAPAVLGVRTIEGIVLFTGTITLPIGERLTIGGSGVMVGISSAQSQILGNYAGPLVSGSVVMSQLALANADLTGSVFAITSPLGRTIRVEYCAIGTGAKAGTIANILGAASIDRVFLNGCAGGFVVSGIIAAIEMTNCAASGMPAASIVFDFASSTNVIRALSIFGCSLISTADTDRLIRIHSSATLPGGALPTTVVGVNIISNKITGPAGAIGRIYDTGASTYDPQSPRIIFKGNPSWPNSRFLGDVDFENPTTPIVTTYVGPAPTAWVPLAHQNAGPTSVLTMLPVSSKFTLVRNVSPTDWYLRFDGPVDLLCQVTWSVAIEASAGGGVGQFIEFRAEIQVAGAGPWVAITGSDRRLEQRAQEGPGTGTCFIQVTTGDRFRLVSRNFSGTGSTNVYQYDLIVTGLG